MAAKAGPETKGRPTLYKGIQMRSRLEADYAGYLDRRGHLWEYEPDCFAGPDGQRLPDFRIRRRRPPKTWLVELKPAGLLKQRRGEGTWEVVDRIDEILARTSIAWLSEPEAVINLIFWTYGANVPDFKVLGVRNAPWCVRGPSAPFTCLWPGMGQQDRLDLVIQDEVTASAR
jgi:hypothetical protein